MFDIVIKNAEIIDGTGRKKYKSDLAVSEGKIKKIGNLGEARAKKYIYAGNLYLVPGFIDINNHSDTYLTIFTIPSLESMLRQGITTIIGGNCGSSLAPLISLDGFKSIQKWADLKEINLNWLTFREFLEELGKRKIGVNFGSLVGHSTLRRGLIKDEFRILTDRELTTVKQIFKSALKEGAFGLSTGLAYSHARIAPTKELIELAKIVKDFDGVYATHIRGEAEELLPAIEETIQIGKKTNVSIEISHLKAMGRNNWQNMKHALDLIQRARLSGINLSFDIYPYTVSGSVLYILLPDWVAEGGREEMLKRLKNKKTKNRIIKEMQEKKYYDYDKIIIAISPIDQTFIGKKMTDIAATQNISVEEAIINLLTASSGRIITFFDTLNEENLEMGISHSSSLVSTDGYGCDINHYKIKKELVHPRCFGAIPRFLEIYTKKKKLLSWEEAIRKISGGPAQKIGIKDRGIIKKNNRADLVLLNPKRISDKSSFDNPYQYPEGIECVVLNGEIVIENGIYNGKKAGMILKKS